MTAKLRSFLRGSKDAALAVAVQTFFNTKYGQIGEMTDLSVNTGKREVRMRLQLAGEAEPVEIHVANYTVEHSGNRAALTITDATASRPWVTGLLREFVIGRTFAIPERATAVVKLLT